MGRSVIGGSVSTYLPVPVVGPADAWVAAVVVNGGTVSPGRKTLVASLISDLQTDGVFAKLDRLWLLAGEDEPSALTDIIANSLATAVSSPVFTVDRGYYGAIASNVDGNFTPSTAGGLWTLNTACLFSWIASTLGGDPSHSIESTSGPSHIFPRFSDNNQYVRMNDAASTGFAVADEIGLALGSRTSSSNIDYYRNNTALGSLSTAPLGLDTASIIIMLGRGVITQRTTAAAGFGGALTPTDAGNLYARLRTYMTAVGVP
jgi:hypothetical protein